MIRSVSEHVFYNNDFYDLESGDVLRVIEGKFMLPGIMVVDSELDQNITVPMQKKLLAEYHFNVLYGEILKDLGRICREPSKELAVALYEKIEGMK